MAAAGKALDAAAGAGAAHDGGGDGRHLMLRKLKQSDYESAKIQNEPPRIKECNYSLGRRPGCPKIRITQTELMDSGLGGVPRPRETCCGWRSLPGRRHLGDTSIRHRKPSTGKCDENLMSFPGTNCIACNVMSNMYSIFIHTKLNITNIYQQINSDL